MKRFLAIALLAAACGGGGGTTNDCKAALLPGDLVITEIFADYAAPSGTSGSDTGKEWFELYNASPKPVAPEVPDAEVPDSEGGDAASGERLIERHGRPGGGPSNHDQGVRDGKDGGA